MISEIEFIKKEMENKNQNKNKETTEAPPNKGEIKTVGGVE